MNKELEALINKALYENKEADNKEEENKPVELTAEEKEAVYQDDISNYKTGRDYWNNK